MPSNAASGRTKPRRTKRDPGAPPPYDLPIDEAVRERAATIHARLRKAQPAPKVELDHENAWQLLVATILAARSNDKTINTITPVLFERWPAPADLAAADPGEVEVVVKKSGFYRNKAKAIRKTAQAVLDDFDGEVPSTMAELVTLPGVARKTANVVLSSVFGANAGVVVDLHVTRLVERLGLTTSKDAKVIEGLLCALFPKRSWGAVGHRLVLHGRHVCQARKPRCSHCPINEVCPSATDEPAGRWGERAQWARVLTESRGETNTTEPAR